MKLLNKDGKEVHNTIDFGIVAVGDSKDFEYYLYNDSGTNVVNIKINLVIEGDSKELKIIESPSELKDEEKGLIKINWTPNLTIKRGLKASIKISGTELWE